MRNSSAPFSRFRRKSLPAAGIEALTQIVHLVLMCVLMCKVLCRAWFGAGLQVVAMMVEIGAEADAIMTALPPDRGKK
jgi:hypothetical protein